MAGGHRTEPPKEDTYSGVVSLEGVRMGFILAHMNKFLICAGDVGNDFLYGKTQEKVFVLAGHEFIKEVEGKRMIMKSFYMVSRLHQPDSMNIFLQHCSLCNISHPRQTMIYGSSQLVIIMNILPDMWMM